ncbi:CLUMA_CG010474, isoform A [Clunio marinus]|uniref:CLUMA_CG010474, isoform A n=1 Tax=Clunio marinus TaxID=568069 RepID=A0A1J1I9W8_9DIPT|nr:CLUMA_CG010474, isoform A [Clunio marinus]
MIISKLFHVVLKLKLSKQKIDFQNLFINISSNNINIFEIIFTAIQPEDNDDVCLSKKPIKSLCEAYQAPSQS